MKIKHFFFDLDHTLWDYDQASHETLTEIYEHFNLGTYEASQRTFLETFYRVNGKLWQLYNEKRIDRDYIKKQRFRKIFNQLDMDPSRSFEVSQYFILNCSKKSYLMPDTLSALDYLKTKYTLHIITNGFKDSQGSKVKHSRLDGYFDQIITSECADSRKPAPEIFEYSLRQAGASKSDSIMVGDNNSTDIAGAQNFGMRSVFYDPSGKKKSLADYTIQSHRELIDLF
ncbi:MAG: YjjG family noncanonical pyrimidine nucleotidase [Bacteroidota bacterium]